MRPSLRRGSLWLSFAVLASGATFTHAQTHYVYADVVGVEPIGSPHSDCAPSRYEGNPVSALVGGLIGGLLGNQFGGGSGRAALTVAGAMAGAAFAGRPRRARCVEGPVANEYRVWYRYHGQEFSKRTPEYPGEHILVAVDVQPAYP